MIFHITNQNYNSLNINKDVNKIANIVINHFVTVALKISNKTKKYNLIETKHQKNNSTNTYTLIMLNSYKI